MAVIRYIGAAVGALLTLVATFYGLSKAIEPITSGVVAIIGRIELAIPDSKDAEGSRDAEGSKDEAWCRKQPNQTLQLAESYRNLCDDSKPDCGSECRRVPTTVWSDDCKSHSSVSVCIPSNPLLGTRDPS